MDEQDKRLAELYRARKTDYEDFRRRRFNRKFEDAPSKLEGLIKDFFGQDEQATQKLDQTRAVQAWPGIVGDSASRASQPVGVKNGRLIVRVPDPVWRQQLLFLRRDILENYRRQFPSLKLTDIYFVA